MKNIRTCRILGVNICATDMQETVRYIMEGLRELSGGYICLCNVHTLIMASDDSGYAAIENGAVLTLPDGEPIAAEERRRGYAGSVRVAGPDLMSAIFDTGGSVRHYFYGSSEETLKRLRKNLCEKYPDIQIAGMFSPPFTDEKEQEEDDAEDVSRINSSGADIIWVGLGAPKQERWMARHKDRISGIMIGVGAGFDFHAGTVSRAPEWMQKAGLEWLYRLAQDPGRLFRRYFISNTRYLMRVGRDRRENK